MRRALKNDLEAAPHMQSGAGANHRVSAQRRKSGGGIFRLHCECNEPWSLAWRRMTAHGTVRQVGDVGRRLIRACGKTAFGNSIHMTAGGPDTRTLSSTSTFPFQAIGAITALDPFDSGKIGATGF